VRSLGFITLYDSSWKFKSRQIYQKFVERSLRLSMRTYEGGGGLFLAVKGCKNDFVVVQMSYVLLFVIMGYRLVP
jgi:hypothetical protein